MNITEFPILKEPEEVGDFFEIVDSFLDWLQQRANRELGENILEEDKLIFDKYEALREIVKNLWNVHQYNQEYISYLLRLISKEEFMELAKRYAVTKKDVLEEDKIVFLTNLLFDTLQQPLSSSDISLLLNVYPRFLYSYKIEDNVENE